MESNSVITDLITADIIIEIIQHLDFRMLLTLMLLSKKFYMIISTSGFIWKKFRQHYNLDHVMDTSIKFNHELSYEELYNNISKFLFVPIKTYGKYCQEYYFVLLEEYGLNIYDNYCYDHNFIKKNYNNFCKYFLPFVKTYSQFEELEALFTEIIEIIDKIKDIPLNNLSDNLDSQETNKLTNWQYCYQFTKNGNLNIYCKKFNEDLYDYFRNKPYYHNACISFGHDDKEHIYNIINYSLDKLPSVHAVVTLIYKASNVNTE